MRYVLGKTPLVNDNHMTSTDSHLDCGVTDISGDLVVTPLDGDGPRAGGLDVGVGGLLAPLARGALRDLVLPPTALHTGYRT